MRAFVTGGTGFIGSHLVDSLLESEKYKEVKCLVRSNEKWLSDKPYTKVTGDLSNLQLISDSLENVDIIFHLAGLVKAPTWSDFKAANVDATENLIRIAQKKGVKNVVVLSSMSAVGPSYGTPLDESAPFKPVSMYGESKMEMEKLLHKIHSPEMSLKIIRPPAVYGPREEGIYNFFKTFKLGICPMVGDGNNPTFTMVYISDLVDGILKASEIKKNGLYTYFLGGEQDEYSWNQIRKILNTILGMKAIPVYLKLGWIHKIASVVEFSGKTMGKFPPLNRDKALEMVNEWVCSSEQAKKELGYNPKVTIEEGLSRTIRWYKKHKWL